MENMLQDTETLTNNESRRERFIRLGNKRLENACQFIDLIENLLKNRNAYEYTDKDVEIVISRLHNKIERLKKYWRADPMQTYSQPN